MSPTSLKTAFTVAVLWTLVASAGDQSAERAIHTVFAQYKDALLQGDGAKAAGVVSTRTIVFYDGIVTHALKTPRTELNELDFISKFMVLRIRHEFTKSELSEMTGRKLLERGVDRGWISKSSVANIDRLVNLEVDSSKASAAIPSAPGIAAFHFLKESGEWKLDLAASFALANAAMKQKIAKSGLTEEQFIIRALNLLSSTPVDDRIFAPQH
ncbi:MAG TPA: hypothetical protein VGQ76_07730 [Thermoanaerobaculia bacterium]|nr:hypothetical protein [Thermoanaerobaculia bacterium]